MDPFDGVEHLDPSRATAPGNAAFGGPFESTLERAIRWCSYFYMWVCAIFDCFRCICVLKRHCSVNQSDWLMKQIEKKSSKIKSKMSMRQSSAYIFAFIFSFVCVGCSQVLSLEVNRAMCSFNPLDIIEEVKSRTGNYYEPNLRVKCIDKFCSVFISLNGDEIAKIVAEEGVEYCLNDSYFHVGGRSNIECNGKFHQIVLIIRKKCTENDRLLGNREVLIQFIFTEKSKEDIHNKYCGEIGTADMSNHDVYSYSYDGSLGDYVGVWDIYIKNFRQVGAKMCGNINEEVKFKFFERQTKQGKAK